MAPLVNHASVVLLGSAHGHFALLDWKRMQRSSFSLKPSPTILTEWLSYKGLDTPGSHHMGIRHVRVETISSVPSSHPCANSMSCWTRFRFTWTTSCGWVLSTTLDFSPAQTKAAKVYPAELWFQTNRIKCFNARGEPLASVAQGTCPWSLPPDTCASHGNRSLLTWSKVADVYQLLPHHDQRVLDATSGQPKTVRGMIRPGLWILSTLGIGYGRPQVAATRPARLERLALPSSRCGDPTACAIHPSNEWIVLGTASHGLFVYHHHHRGRK